MNLLTDTELVASITGPDPIVCNLPTPPAVASPPTGAPSNPWFGKDSPIQASSVDLHIGDIFVPDTERNTHYEANNIPKRIPKELSLELGHTAVIVTKETLALPDNIASFGFPPSRLSFRGLLMTNPGHVDPGYKGKLRFTVMNIGKESITLREDDPIVTLLFVRLDNPATAGYGIRNPNAPTPPASRDDVNRLSQDFLDVTNRANKAATGAIRDAELKVKLWGLAVPVLIALASLLVGYNSLDRVKADIDQLKQRFDRGDEVIKLQKRVDELEMQIKHNNRSGNRN